MMLTMTLSDRCVSSRSETSVTGRAGSESAGTTLGYSFRNSLIFFSRASRRAMSEPSSSRPRSDSRAS